MVCKYLVGQRLKQQENLTKPLQARDLQEKLMVEGKILRKNTPADLTID